MDRFESIRLFIRVVDAGGFSAAARGAGLSQSAVSKRVSALEAHLGTQLLRRNSRSQSVTEAGQIFYEAGVKLLNDLEAAEGSVGTAKTAPAGLVRVAVAAVFSRMVIVPQLPGFFAKFPGVSVELAVSDRSVDLIEEGLDLAIRNGDQGDSALIARKLGASPFVTVATPAYLELYGIPSAPADLERHRCVVFTSRGVPAPWLYRGRGELFAYRPKGQFSSDDAESIRAAVLCDLGIAHAPSWMFSDDIEAGTVRTVLEQHQGHALPIFALRPNGRRSSPKVAVLIEFLADAFAKNPNLA